MSELVEFIRGCLDADEQTARAAGADLDWNLYNGFNSWTAIRADGAGRSWFVGEFQYRDTAAHIARHDPARVLAEVNAKRAILDEHPPTDPYNHEGDRYCRRCLSVHDDTGWPDEWVQAQYPCPTLLALAQPYAGEPGWRDEWGTQ